MQFLKNLIYDIITTYCNRNIFCEYTLNSLLLYEKIVAKTISSDFKKWPELPGKNRQPHDPNNILRKFNELEEKFLNK